mmetsp:Transcript_9170/g.17498  ORF Transcript_9170/g.17498 Transcript_9170/m.17498 type:complete len:147 (+) Transcript_9170:306-746(+)
MEQIANKLHNQGGAALIIDYGEDHPQENTLQAMANQKTARVLERPGEVDITSHVDFSALRDVTKAASDKLQVFPVVPQGMFLINMNIEARMHSLLKGAEDEEKEAIQRQAMHLVGEDKMGLLFKVMAVTQEGIGAPAGWPEDAVSE